MRGAVGKRIVLPLHIFGSLLAGMVVSTVTWRNLSPCARWPLLLLASPACIFNLVSPPALSSSRWRGRICCFLPAGRFRSSPRRRAFFILFLRRRYRLHGGVDEFAAFCTLAAAVLRLAGVHFYSVSPPALSSSRWRGRICRLLHAGCCRSLLRRRAFLILFLRRRYRFGDDAARNLSPCARWSLPFLIIPACIFYSVSPPARSPRRCRR